MRILSGFDVNAICGSFAMARSYKVNPDVECDLRRFPHNIDYSFVSRVHVYDGAIRENPCT